MPMKITEIADELFRIADERGEVEGAIPDPIEATWITPVDRVEFDAERQLVLFVSDR
jgi:hypothetical protein